MWQCSGAINAQSLTTRKGKKNKKTWDYSGDGNKLCATVNIWVANHFFY